MRGEYNPSRSISQSEMELPPRARRILEKLGRIENESGTTSACAENTRVAVRTNAIYRNYLRVRGEYLRRTFSDNYTRGTTSACAENTTPSTPPGTVTGNYLRVRGEYFFRTHRREKNAELPPRARRIPFRWAPCSASLGTTSACAENTACRLSILNSPWNYLRVRGEYPK